MKHRDIQSPFGDLCVTEIDGAVTALRWKARGQDHSSAVLDQAEAELTAYFAGEEVEFKVPMHVDASEFQIAVCDAMRAIPFGETCTYGDIAKALGVPAQAIGQACGGNPIPILIPCHRVMGAGGRLTGFSGQGGVETKVALLRHEGAGGFLL
ncbi:MAG: methylated-DNA--[protein]-cysteine S-methyltransferase [Paracoccaceae bacterium]